MFIVPDRRGGSNRFVPVRLNQNQSVRSQKRRERFNVIIKSYSKFENLEKFRKILPHFLPNCWIFVIWFFWTTGLIMIYYPEKVWKIGPFNLSTKKDRKHGFKDGKFCVQLDVFLFEHGSGSDPNLIPVLDYPEIRL